MDALIKANGAYGKDEHPSEGSEEIARFHDASEFLAALGHDLLPYEAWVPEELPDLNESELDEIAAGYIL